MVTVRNLAGGRYARRHALAACLLAVNCLVYAPSAAQVTGAQKTHASRTVTPNAQSSETAKSSESSPITITIKKFENRGRVPNEHLDSSGNTELELAFQTAAESRGDLSVQFYSPDDMNTVIATGSDINRNQSVTAPKFATPDYIIQPTYTAVDASGEQFILSAELIRNHTPVWHVNTKSFADKNDDDPTLDLGSKLAVELRKKMQLPVFTLHNVKLRVRCSPIDGAGVAGTDLNPIQLERMAASSVTKELLNSPIVELLSGPEEGCSDKPDNEASNNDELYLVVRISTLPVTDPTSGQRLVLYFFELTLRSTRGPLFSPHNLPCKELQSWSEAGTRMGRMVKQQLESPRFQETKLRQEE